METTIKKWELKDRTYMLKSMAPLTYKVKARGIIWFDEEKGINREIRYAKNQNSLFVDEQKGPVQLGHIVFVDGVLHTRKSDPMIQQLLSIYHPKAGIDWFELDHQQDAEDELDYVEYQLEAMNVAQEMDIEHLEAILRTELGSAVSTMTSKELKRDGYRFARNNPKLFLEVANDEDIKLRNLANRAVEMGILNLTENGTVFKLSSNNKKILTVPFDQHPYVALTQYFKTDDGVALMKSLLKKLS